jgi:hypothetical protein
MTVEHSTRVSLDFLREGGRIGVFKEGLCGFVGGLHYELPGEVESMDRLVDSGVAVKTGQGFWVSTTCRECGGVTIPGFHCCSVPYA